MSRTHWGLGLAFVALAVAAAGCVMWDKEGREERAGNASLIDQYSREMVENGILAQHTLFPYHFATGTADLTELGLRDLRVLTALYKQSPGALNVNRGDESDDLYQARVERVRGLLADGGVDLGRMTIADGLAGGSGMASTRVQQVLSREAGKTGQNARRAGAPGPRPAPAPAGSS